MAKILKAVTSLFKPQIAKVASAVMPDPDSGAAKIAAQKKVAARKGAGREGTIFGGAYGNTNLGGTQ